MIKTKFKAYLKEKIKLNLDDGKKNIYHLSLQIDASDFQFQTGSCIAVHPKNPKPLLHSLFSILGHDPKTVIKHPKSGDVLTAEQYFLSEVNFYQTRKSLVQLVYNKEFTKDEMKEYTSLDLLTFLEKSPHSPPTIQDLIENTAPLLPRYYSISSSQRTNANQIDLMVSVMQIEHKHIKVGIASGYLIDQVQVNETIEFSYHQNDKFTLTDCEKTPIIMIGPGTGFAPFRGFLQDLEIRKNPRWLFSGAPNKKTHFYYKNELLNHEENHNLKLSLAFSRDQAEKIYVQNLMMQESSLLFDWIDKQNAHIYICGDAKKMAKDVQEVLATILIKHKKLESKEAKDYLKQMRMQGRLNLDVY